jgi:hypothetical protein
VGLAAAAGAQSAQTRLESPSLAEIANGAAAIPDAAPVTGSQRALPVPGTYWGGTFTASTGESVTVYVSNSYPQDPATGQRWADFLAGLLHGAELSSLATYFAPLDEVQRICGSGALGCYSSVQQLLVAPGEDPAPDLSVEAVVTHEYGHHLAANRSNAPWAALDYGTKRWASYEQVCAKTRGHALFPGAEQPPLYRLNPGEAFAETYRVLNERRAGVAEATWAVVSQTLYPDATALALTEQDVTTPWKAQAATVRVGSVSKTRRVRTYSVATPLDGTFSLTLRPPTRARLALDVYSSAGRVAHAAGAKALSAAITVCGERSVRIRVSRIGGAGTFRLSVAPP